MASLFRSLPLAALALVASASAQGTPEKPRPAQPARPAVKLRPAAPQPQKPQEELVALREKKLAKDVFQNAEWFLDYDKARAAAKEQGKLLLVYFTRSYAYCGPCETLEKSVLSTEEFKEWSQNVVLFLHITSKVEDEPYPDLLHEKGGNSFPTLSYLDAEGHLLKQVGHVVPVETLERERQFVERWRALKAKAENGGADVQRELFRMELEMGILDPVAARATADELFEGEARKALEQELVNLEFLDILKKTPRDQMAMGGKRFVDMYRLGRIPNASQDTSFWQYMFAFAASEGDVDLFEELLGFLKQNKADDPRLAGYLKRLEADLQKLKGGN